MEEVKTLTINDKKITVKKLPLRKIISLLEAVGKLPQEIGDIDQKNASEIVSNLGIIIASSLPKFVDVIVKAVDQQDVTPEFILDECDFNDALDLIIAILEVNNVAGILQRLKKIKALNQSPAVVKS